MGENILEISNLHFKYSDGTEALKGIDIGIQRGKMTALLGGNGAGKSTLFLHLNGIHKPSSGTVTFEGAPVDYSRAGLKQLRKEVGIVFQDPDNQLFSASVYQDVSFGPMNLQLPEEEVRKRVERSLVRTGISHLRDKPTHCLSYGQKKRVAIAGVLAMEPSLLVFDEPTAGLDPKGVADLMRMLKKTMHEMNMSIVIATHEVDLVPLYCDYVYALDGGKVVLQGTPKEVFAQRSAMRKINLRMTRIGHLMEILELKDGFEFDDTANTLAEARVVLDRWKKKNGL